MFPKAKVILIDKIHESDTPNCRVQFEARDIDFIISVLGSARGTAECLVRLLSDQESRDQILDAPGYRSNSRRRVWR